MGEHEDRGSVGAVAGSDRSPVARVQDFLDRFEADPPRIAVVHEDGDHWTLDAPDLQDILERLTDTERTVRLLWVALADRGLERHAVRDYGGVERGCIAEVVRNVTGESIASWALA